MDHLSGGEKTIAALALLFAIHSYQPSPFFVLDEVDAALDNTNVSKIGNYIRKHAGPGMQFIVISLKAGLFQGSEALVGIHRDQTANTSKALTLDVSACDETRPGSMTDIRSFENTDEVLAGLEALLAHGQRHQRVSIVVKVCYQRDTLQRMVLSILPTALLLYLNSYQPERRAEESGRVHVTAFAQRSPFPYFLKARSFITKSEA